MTIPTTGTFTSTDVKNEWGYGLPFTSAQVASSAGLSTPWTSDNLRGKSARTVSIFISGGGPQYAGGIGGGQYYDRIIFGVQVSDGAAPSSYQWEYDVSGNGSTTTFDGPVYNQNGFTFQATGTARVTVVIGGQSFSAEVNFTYTAGDLA